VTVVAIPAYEPDHRLVDLAAGIRARAPELDLVVADDGSGVACAPIFGWVADAGVTVLAHEANRGKGAALHTLFRYAGIAHPGEAVVTADADGQHTPEDIVRVAHETERAGDAIVLGVRCFAGPDVPWRSRIGNGISARAFAPVIGERIGDTQTGLRGLPPQALPWATRLPGDRFEYEAFMLLGARRAGFRLVQLPIRTVYLEQNCRSHFRPVRDSLRVFVPVLAFLASSLLAAGLDAMLLWGLFAATGWLQGSIVLARIASATVNFTVNRRWVFGRGRPARPLRVELIRYAALALAILAANVALMSVLDLLGVGLVVAKVVTESVLWIVAYLVQRIWVFAHARHPLRDPIKPVILA
jgi:putative flippase GtrA